MFRKASLVGLVAMLVALASVATLSFRLPVGPIVLTLGLVPVSALLLTRRPLSRAVPDLVFGSIDTGLLAIPALLGGLTFGVTGAVAGSVVGDAITDAIAGLFEGSVAEWLRARGFDESREAVTTALGKMAGCLFGSGAVLSVAMLLGVSVELN